MGQKQSSDLDKYQLSFVVNSSANKYTNTKPYKLTKALNVYYVYFKISNYSLNDIINRDIELYISNRMDASSNMISEDVLKTKIENETKINIIEKQEYYDMEYVTSNSKKVIFRSHNMMMNSFDIVYVI